MQELKQQDVSVNLDACMSAVWERLRDAYRDRLRVKICEWDPFGGKAPDIATAFGSSKE